MNIRRFMGNKTDYLHIYTYIYISGAGLWSRPEVNFKFITNLKKAVAIRKDKIIQD